MMRPLTVRPIVPLLVAVGAASLVGGCGRTLVFAESEGVNLAIRTNASSDTPAEVNFGLNRTVGTIVPPAGQKNGKPDGEAVNMLAGFEVNNSLVPTKPIDADLTIDTQFASGKAATKVAENPEVAAQIANLRPMTFATTDSAKQFRAWLRPDGKLSKNRAAKLQDWLNKRYPTKQVTPFQLYAYDSDEYEADRVAALKELKDVPAN